MSIRQIFKPDFWVCEYEGKFPYLGITEYGTFPVYGQTEAERESDAQRWLNRLSSEGKAIIRKPTLLERWRAA